MRNLRFIWALTLNALLSFVVIGTASVTSTPKKYQASGASSRIEFTLIPPYGSSQNLSGRVRNVPPESYKVAVYIFIEGSGWWTKPTFAQPLTYIQNDSTWICDITTGGNDIYATQICAFLLRNGINPPQAGGLANLPASLDTLSVARVSTARERTIISFSGYQWWVKASVTPVGPGPNYFSDSVENVWVDSQSQLHLKITKRNGLWHCAEVILKNSLGYGRYAFYVTGKVGQLDPNVVLGLFTWDNASEEFHREIDIEFSRWGVPSNLNSQYVVQPWNQPGNLLRWDIPPSLDFSTHSFDWKPDSISFLSARGHLSGVPADSILHTWNYTGPNIPSRGNENARINLWLFNGQPPTDNAEVEIIITKFEYGTSTSVDGQDPALINQYSLSQNYPNPFNPSTTIAYDLPNDANVQLIIYNTLGEPIRTLVNSFQAAGRHRLSWDGKDDSQKPLASGVYLYRLQTEDFAETKRLLLMR